MCRFKPNTPHYTNIFLRDFLRDLHLYHPTTERILRQAKLWKGGCDDLKSLKLFIATQRVQLPHGKGQASQPEPSVAWRAATHDAKHTQGVAKQRY